MTRWLVIDPSGNKHNVEEDDGHLFGAENVAHQVQLEMKKGRVGKVYGWQVDFVEEVE